MKWLIRILIVVFLIGLGFLIYSKFLKPKSTTPQYQTAKAQKGTLVATVSASGQVSTANNTPIVTSVTGKITKLYVKNGDNVTAGFVIATLELDQSSRQKYTQQLSSYESAKNSLESAKTTETSLRIAMNTAEQDFIKEALNKSLDVNSSKYKELKSERSYAREKFDNQENVINQTQIALNSATLSLQNLSPTIYAPIPGIITGLSLREGSVIPAQAISSSTQTLSQNIASITTSSYPIVTINLSEIDIPKVNIGSKATLTFDAFPGKTFTGKVFSINTTGTVSSGVTTYPTTIDLDVENADVYANMSATASIIIDTKDNVLYVPVNAVQNQNGQSTVRVLKGGQVESVAVETGISSDSDIEVVSGLNEGDEVVTAVITATTGQTNTTSSPFGIRTGGFGGGGRNPGR
jgi:RND family efflux transporter MFP subunit